MQNMIHIISQTRIGVFTFFLTLATFVLTISPPFRIAR